MKFVWPSDAERAENEELNRVCEYAEELYDELQEKKKHSRSWVSRVTKIIDFLDDLKHESIPKYKRRQAQAKINELKGYLKYGWAGFERRNTNEY